MNEFLRQLLALPPQATDMARQIDYLHYVVFLTTMAGGLLTLVATGYLLVRFRRKHQYQLTEHVDSPKWMEAAFLVVPLVIFLAWFRIGFGQFARITTPPKDAMDVYVTGKKWMWKFAYPEGPNGVNTLRVPAGRNVRLLITSRDVIHSVFVPAFRLKQDAVPLRYTQAWFKADLPGTYPLFCTEFCGADHSKMRAQVIVMEPEAYQEWIAAQRRGDALRADSEGNEGIDPRADLVTQGERLAGVHGCLKCHTVDGTQHIGPTFKNLYMSKVKLADGSSLTADEAYITESMMDPEAKQADGYQLQMPAYVGKLNPMETAAIVEFIRSLRDREGDAPLEGPTYEPIKR